MEVRHGYKQTGVGVLPDEWEVKRLGELADIVSGGTPRTNEPSYWNGGIKWCTPTDITRCAGKYLTETERTISRDGLNNSGATLLPVGALLLCSRATIGEIKIAGTPICTNQGFKSLVCRPRVSNEFLYYKLLTMKQQMVERAFGSTFLEISTRNVSSLEVATPLHDEQTSIAAALSDVDALLAGLDRLIAKKRDLKQAAMQQLLTGQTRLPGFRGEWEVRRLGDIATFYKGRSLPKSSLSLYGAEPCVHYGELFTRYPETIDTILSRTDDTVGAFRSVANDVLMPTSDVTPRGLAKASCVQVDGVILGGDILVIRCNSKLVVGSFLSYKIRHQEDQILQLVTGTTVFHLYGRDMAKLTLSMPSVEEQTAIAAILSDMDAELTAHEALRDKTRTLKQGMMQELLTGRTRLIETKRESAAAC